MFEFSGIQLSVSVIEVSLAASVIFFASLTFFSLRRISSLEAKLQTAQLTMAREIKMVNQGAIGMGRRFAIIEKNLKKPTNVANFESAKELKRTPSRTYAEAQAVVQRTQKVETQPVKERTRGLTTRAEHALSEWINDHQTA